MKIRKPLSNNELKALLNSVNQNELSTLLTRHFQVIKDTQGERRIIRYEKKDEEDKNIVFEFNNKGNIESVEFSHDEFINPIVDEVKTSLQKTIPKFGHTVVYTSFHFKTEYFLYENKILLRPIYQPYTDRAISQTTPAILEFYYDGSSDERVDVHRRYRTEVEIIWILNVLLKMKIGYTKPFGIEYYGYSVINMPKTDDPNNIFMKGYQLKNFESIIDKVTAYPNNELELFKNFNLSPAKVVGDSNFFSEPIEHGKLVVANYTKYILKKYYDNDSKNKIFILSCYWFYQSEIKVNSDQIIALATSLECLIDKNSVKCEHCKQEKFSIKKKVKDLVEEYCGSLNVENKALITLISEFYDIRSSIVHGLSLPVIDVPNIRAFDPVINKITNNISYFSLVVRLVILNWYFDKKLDVEISLIKTDLGNPIVGHYQLTIFPEDFKPMPNDKPNEN